MANYIYRNGELINADELQHANPKYLRREPKPGGGWRYYYTLPMDRSGTKVGIYEKTQGDKNSKYGTYEHNNRGGKKDVVNIKKGNKLFSSTKVSEGRGHKYTEKSVGLIRQYADKAVSSMKKQAQKGAKKLKMGQVSL